jgi:hypothetical protein
LLEMLGRTRNSIASQSRSRLALFEAGCSVCNWRPWWLSTESMGFTPTDGSVFCEYPPRLIPPPLFYCRMSVRLQDLVASHDSTQIRCGTHVESRLLGQWMFSFTSDGDGGL